MSKQARIPSYRRHSSGQATVRIHGKDFYLGAYGTAVSRREYDRLINEWLANGRRLAVTQADRVITVVEFIAAFWEHAKTWYVKNGQPTDELAAYTYAKRRCGTRSTPDARSRAEERSGSARLPRPIQAKYRRHWTNCVTKSAN